MIIGLVGKTNSGKSSFFKAATMIDVEIANRPFVTINPNVGIAHVIIDCVCKEFGKTCNPKNGMCKNGKRFVPVKLVDVAGLVPGAHEGRGLGNKFLDDIRQASVLIQVVDFSGLTDEEGKPTRGRNPQDDIKFLEEEIDLWLASVIQKATSKIGKVKTKSDLINILSEQLSGLEIKREHIENLIDKFSVDNVNEFARELRKISKPMVIVANKIDLPEAQENFEKMKNGKIIPTSADYEIALKKAAGKNMIEYFPGNGFEIKNVTNEQQKSALEKIEQLVEKYGSTGVQKCLNYSVFSLLNYIAVFPVADSNKSTDKDGNILPDVFLVPNGTTVKELAFKVHTSIGEKFIAGIDARTKRKLSADYELKDRDIVEIVFAK